jgi:predicted PurR-regulated permease PerM
MRSKADIVIAVAVVLTIIYLAEAPLAVLFVSAILAFMLDPLVAGIEKLRLGRSLSALLAVLLLLACLYASFVPILTFFMLTWKEHVWAASVRQFKEPNRSDAHDTLGQISAMMRRFIVGNVLVGFFIGTVSLIVFGIIRLPHIILSATSAAS